MTRSKLKWRYKLDRTTINFEKNKKNVMFVSIFYVKVKNNNLTILTLKMQQITKSFGNYQTEMFE